MIKDLTIFGFRGFSKACTVAFARPDREHTGSGLTMITGANNCGKTTIIESIQAFIGKNPPSFSEGRRNWLSGDRVFLTITTASGEKCQIQTVPEGGSSTEKMPRDFDLECDIIPSRRSIYFEFSRARTDKRGYVHSQSLANQRQHQLNNYESRIFQIQQHRMEFDGIVRSILASNFQWTIEQRDSGQYYIKYKDGTAAHSGEGIGDGVWSVFTICAAFCDAKLGDVIIIDEPELSIHPAVQRRLMEFLIAKSKDYQIIISTHSPYFVSWHAIAQGAQLVRVVKENGEISCYALTDAFRRLCTKQLNNMFNPHVLGFEAREVFFCEDKVILTEGQEDVVIYQKVAADLGLRFHGVFYGWGAGGAGNIELFLSLFRALGYRHVVAVFDGDKRTEAQKSKEEFPEYAVLVLPADDIRDKKGKRSLASEDGDIIREEEVIVKEGITDDHGNLKEEYREEFEKLVEDINRALDGSDAAKTI